MEEETRTKGAALGDVGRFVGRHKKLFVFLVIAIVIVAIVASMLNSAAASTAPPPTTALQRMDLTRIVAGTGTLQSTAPREVTSSLSYDIVEVYVKEGDHVAEGQSLALVDSTDLDKSIADVKESIAEAEAKDALSRSQTQRKLQDAIDTRQINLERNEASVQKALDAINAARHAAGSVAMEAAAVAAAADTQATLASAQMVLSTAQAAYTMADVAYQTVLGQQNLVAAEEDPTAKAALLASFGFADEAALSAAVAAADAARAAEQPKVDAAAASVTAAQQAYDSTLNNFKADSNNQHIYSDAYNAADVGALQTSYDTAVQTKDTSYRNDTISIQSVQDSLNTQKLTDNAASYRNQLEGYLEDKEDCLITAPVSGTITAMTAEVGKSAGGSAMGSAASGGTAASGALFTIEDVGRLEITSSIPEYDVVNVEEGMQVKVTSDALANEEWAGVVSAISAKATDTSGNFTVTVAVTGDAGALAIGMSAKINIITQGKTDVFAVPYDAVTTNENGDSVVYVLAEDAGQSQTHAEAGPPKAGSAATPAATARPIVVETGLETDYYIEISGEGLTDGLLVLTDPEGKNVPAAADEGIAGMPFRG